MHLIIFIGTTLILPLVMGASHLSSPIFIAYAALAGAASVAAEVVQEGAAVLPPLVELAGEWLGKSIIVAVMGGFAFILGQWIT